MIPEQVDNVASSARGNDWPSCLECGRLIQPDEGRLRLRNGDIHSDCFGEIPPPRITQRLRRS